MKLDAAGRRVLEALVANPDAELSEVAETAELSENVARERMQRLRDNGTILGRSIRINPASLGLPYEALALARPSPQTTRRDLDQLSQTPNVTRVFTLAAEHSIAFTVVGKDAKDVEQRAADIAEKHHLEALSLIMMVETLADDVAQAIHRSWQPENNAPALEATLTSA